MVVAGSVGQARSGPLSWIAFRCKAKGDWHSRATPDFRGDLVGMILARHERPWRVARTIGILSGEALVTPAPPASNRGPESDRSLRTGHILVFLTAWVLTQVAVALVQSPEVFAGAQVDSDGYFRLMRVRVLLDGGGWYNETIPISNWPFGQELHWTRPLDVLIVLLALPWSLVVPMETALAIAGALVSPLLHAVLCLAGIWVIAPLVPGSVRFLAAAALLAHPGVMAYATVGRADHHVLVLLLSVVAIGAWIRALLEPDRPRWASWTGLAAAAAIWVSPEALVPLAAILASGGLAWVVRGARYSRTNLQVCLALGVGLCVSIAVERPPGEWLLAEYDRISAVHVLMALLAIGFWLVVNALSARLTRVSGRVIVAGSGGILTFATLFGLHPGFFLGPGAAMEPWLREFVFDSIAELQPIIGWSWEDFGRTVALLGLAPPVLWFAGRSVLPGTDAGRSVGWYPVFAGVLLFVPMAAAQTRLVPYAGAILALAATGLLATLLAWTNRRYDAGLRRRFLRLGTMLAVLVGPLVLGGAISALGGGDDPSEAAGSGENCLLGHAIHILEAERQGQNGPQVVAVAPNLGPALAYRTGDRIIAGLSHRSPEGLRDLFEFFRTSDMERAAELARVRELDVVLICPPLDRSLFGVGFPASLYSRLVDGVDAPSWLHPIPIDDERAGGFLGYRVVMTGGRGG
jgi:hypothetical protein